MNKLLSRDFLALCHRFLGPKTVRYIVIGIFVGLILFGVELGFAYALQAFLVAIDVMNASSTRLPDWIPIGSFWQVLAFVCAVGFLRGILQWIQAYFLEAVSEVQKCEQRRRIVDFAFTSKSANTGEIVSLFNDHAHSAGLLANHLEMFAIRITSSILIFGWLFWKAPVPTMAFTMAFGLIGLLVRRLERKIAVAGRACVSDWNSISSRIITNIRNLLLMQVYGTQDLERRGVVDRIDSYESNFRSYSANSGLLFAIPHIFGIFLISGVTILLKGSKAMPVGDLVSYFYMTVRFVQMIADMTRNVAGIQFYWPRVRHLFDWWRSSGMDRISVAPTDGGGGAGRLSSPVGWVFKDVRFRYPEAAKPVFDSLSLEIPLNKTTVITGQSGAGKSTLINLMLGNLDPESGQIEVLHRGDGANSAIVREPLKNMREELFHVIGYVSSDGFITEGTIRENLSYALRRKPSEEEIRGALKDAECQFVFDLPEGLEHRISEQGHGLSAGQKQRLSLARALLRKPKILILDEATSNLDFETEQRLVKTLAGFKSTMTIVAVTHRLALLQNADHKLEIN